MTKDELLAVLEDAGYFVDFALLFHGYRNYMRDYDLIMWAPSFFKWSGTYSAVLKHCVEVDIRSAVPADVWRTSLDDRLTQFDAFQELDAQGEYHGGIIWHLGWSNLYPGWSVPMRSARADFWTREVGIDFHEVQIESNAYVLTAIFADLVISKLSVDNDDPQINGVPIWLTRYTDA